MRFGKKQVINYFGDVYVIFAQHIFFSIVIFICFASVSYDGLSKNEIISVQQKLKNLNYSIGEIDGIIGSR